MADSAEYTWLHSQAQVLDRLSADFTKNLPGGEYWQADIAAGKFHSDIQDKPASQNGQDWLIRAYREHNATIPPVATTKEMAAAYQMRMVDLNTEASTMPEGNANDVGAAARALASATALAPAAVAAKAAGATIEQALQISVADTTSSTTLYAAIAGGVVFLGALFLVWKRKTRKRAAAAARPVAAAAAAMIPPIPAMTPAAATAAGLGCLCGLKEKREVVLRIRRLEKLVKEHPELPSLRQLLASLKKAVRYRGPRRPFLRVLQARRGRQ